MMCESESASCWNVLDKDPLKPGYGTEKQKTIQYSLGKKQPLAEACSQMTNITWRCPKYWIDCGMRRSDEDDLRLIKEEDTL